MKRVLFLLIIVFTATLSASAKEYRADEIKPCIPPEFQKNNKNLKLDNIIVFDCDLNNNLITGKVKDYYKTGNIYTETPYTNGKISGPTRYYDEDGKPLNGISRETRTSGNSSDIFCKDGWAYHVKFYDKSGRLKEETLYKDSWKNYIKKHYFDDGNLESETTYKDGKKDEIEISYQETQDGMRRIEYSHIDHSRKEYNEDGSLSHEIFYVNGKKHHKHYYKNGTLQRESISVNGAEERRTVYRKDGSLDHESFYVNDKQHEKNYYYPDGKTLLMKVFFKGSDIKHPHNDGVSMKIYDKDEKLKYEIEEKTTNTIVYKYDKDGQKKQIPAKGEGLVLIKELLESMNK